ADLGAIGERVSLADLCAIGVRVGLADACAVGEGAALVVHAIAVAVDFAGLLGGGGGDRKSTRLNSSHVEISYAVFCLKKKNGCPRRRVARWRVAAAASARRGVRCRAAGYGARRFCALAVCAPSPLVCVVCARAGAVVS